MAECYSSSLCLLFLFLHAEIFKHGLPAAKTQFQLDPLNLLLLSLSFGLVQCCIQLIIVQTLNISYLFVSFSLSWSVLSCDYFLLFITDNHSIAVIKPSSPQHVPPVGTDVEVTDDSSLMERYLQRPHHALNMKRTMDDEDEDDLSMNEDGIRADPDGGENSKGKKEKFVKFTRGMRAVQLYVLHVYSTSNARFALSSDFFTTIASLLCTCFSLQFHYGMKACYIGDSVYTAGGIDWCGLIMTLACLVRCLFPATVLLSLNILKYLRV